ncbi:uncharacterized protein [Venturia canescens]|uniref:uncharacterized protein n=1 Tax=Venturia canescens TaxID=32260 RepID=UPI001C9BF968|nr:uncharacterized protein LOC122408462 [Venturia canescens]
MALWLYRAILLPRLKYAAVVWWPAVGRVAYGQRLTSLQGNYLRAGAGVMRTTPTAALEVAFGLLPLNIDITGQAKLTAYRLICMGTWRSTGTGHTDLGLSQRSPFSLQQDKIPRKFQVEKSFRAVIRTREDWRSSQPPTSPGVDAWFTDGSGAGNRFGAGVFNPATDTRLSFPLGELATVFQAEVLAIYECIKICLERNTTGKHIMVHSDSMAALRAVTKPQADSATVWKCMQALNEAGKKNKVTLTWIPGHQGFYGNERADGLAKRGTEIPPAHQVVGVPFATGKNIIQNGLKRQHLHLWKTRVGCRQAKLWMKEPNIGRTKELLGLGRVRLRVGIALLTGHIALRSHLHTMDLAEHRECRLCGEGEESSVHILYRCPTLAIYRYKTWGRMFVEPGEISNLKVTQMCYLAEKAGINAQGLTTD